MGSELGMRAVSIHVGRWNSGLGQQPIAVTQRSNDRAATPAEKTRLWEPRLAQNLVP